MDNVLSFLLGLAAHSLFDVVLVAGAFALGRKSHGFHLHKGSNCRNGEG